ncbi:YkuS family protein [Desulfosporosinus nitroreducens]|uniref:YkuS family protein n=1 Tax=Desulfosporosinus nitroreducens TaxID=2018668 RepID=A0ABT8QJH5_9FIRM|nr:YkuS family protein [Desulfosporosinus nitroreducens]MCO1600370.1 YkuS family protein [Desulfosporosinus nitroreducens]MDO0821458.1 YkuS family protein [Desulfosporosinus nitroreducens]
MYTTIAVEDGLGNVIQALHNAGFKTTPLEGQSLKNNVRAIVVKGDETNILAPEWPVKLPVINASGRSADEIVDVLRDRLS